MRAMSIALRKAATRRLGRPKTPEGSSSSGASRLASASAGSRRSSLEVDGLRDSVSLIGAAPVACGGTPREAGLLSFPVRALRGVVARGQPGPALEGPREGACIGETEHKGDLGDRQPTLLDITPGQPRSGLLEQRLERGSFLVEGALEVARAHAE